MTDINNNIPYIRPQMQPQMPQEPLAQQPQAVPEQPAKEPVYPSDAGGRAFVGMQKKAPIPNAALANDLEMLKKDPELVGLAMGIADGLLAKGLPYENAIQVAQGYFEGFNKMRG
jgi:hypothetical protein